ncbi:MAG: flagellar hook-associated protein FlgK [Thermoguttaceae bacterium]
MTLFNSLHIAGGSLNATSLGIQVAGQNLTNAGTPGYAREVLNLTSAGTLKTYGGTAIGAGVSINGVSQIIDKFVEERLRNAGSELANSSTQSQYYTLLESTMNELTKTDVSTLLTSFFNSISNVQNQPENLIFRQMVGESGMQITDALNRLSTAIVTMEMDINKRVVTSCDQINLLTSQIQRLNEDIAKVESGQHGGTEAVGLRDQRQAALTSLSQLINVRTSEDPQTGMLTVACGGSILVAGGVRNEVKLAQEDTDAAPVSATFLYVGNNRLDVRSGQVYGFYQARDTVLAGFHEEIDSFAASLVQEFNKIYTSGQGLVGYTNLTSQQAVSDPSIPLNEVGLVPAPTSGQFKILVTDSQGITTEHTLDITLRDPVVRDPFSLKPEPLRDGTTLTDLADAINSIEGIVARVDSRNRLVIESESPNLQFSFADDSSGILSGLGLNTFFTGRDAGTISVSDIVLKDPNKFAASRTGPGQDTDIATRLAAMPDTKLPSLGQRSITDCYKAIVSGVNLAGGTTKAVLSADYAHQASLTAQRNAISGVNLDDETISLLAYQRSYQASAKYIGVINAMLEALISM